MRQTVGGHRTEHALERGGVLPAHGERAEGVEQVPPGLGFQVLPQVPGTQEQRHVLGALVIGGAEQTGLSCEGAVAVAQTELLETGDLHPGLLTELPQRHGSGGTQPDHGDTESGTHAGACPSKMLRWPTKSKMKRTADSR